MGTQKNRLNAPTTNIKTKAYENVWLRLID